MMDNHDKLQAVFDALQEHILECCDSTAGPNPEHLSELQSLYFALGGGK